MYIYILTRKNRRGKSDVCTVRPTSGLHVPMCQDEVFDLIADPFETNNLAGMPEHSGVITALDEILARWAELAFPFQDPDTMPSLVEHAAEMLEVSEAASVPVVSDHFKPRGWSHRYAPWA